jgi:tRNA pseudouridine55 synthase
LVEIKARGKFNRRHMVDIPRIKFFAQHRYRANWPFLDGHELVAMPASGVIVLDKPADMSSARAVAKVKKLLGAKKVGHTGTLDPFATGVLICCINQATRLARFFLQGDKTYQAVLGLGVETDTQDITGRVTATTTVPDIDPDHLAEIIKRFEGRQLQLPPVYAALKHEGTPIYKLARQGRPIQKPARPITVTAIRVTAVDLPDIGLEVTCSSGTYVRALCADIGRALGCGGHLKQLRRTVNSGFDIGQAVTLDDLARMIDDPDRNAVLIPMGTALEFMPTFVAGPDTLQRVVQGQILTSAHIHRDRIREPVVRGQGDYVKVVDAAMNLKAVLKVRPDDMGYDYCCVFN